MRTDHVCSCLISRSDYKSLTKNRTIEDRKFPEPSLGSRAIDVTGIVKIQLADKDLNGDYQWSIDGLRSMMPEVGDLIIPDS